jgi:hypothetical protein
MAEAPKSKHAWEENLIHELMVNHRKTREAIAFMRLFA